MRQAARAIVIKDGQLLVMHRNKFGEQYDTLPGGGVDMGETPDQTIIREIQEETSIQTANHRLVFIEQAGEPYGTQYIYLADYVAGEPVLHPESEEAQINQLGQNLYEPKWVALTDLPQLPFVSEKLKNAILGGVASGFPAEPTEIL